MSKLEGFARSRRIFRAYDIRGNINILTPDLIQQIAQALAIHYLEQGQSCVVVGHDARLSSPEYADHMADILQLSGMQVIQIGCVSSPVLYFTALRYQGNGIMITASHNPVSDNGIKWLVKGLPPSAEQIQQLADRIEIQDVAPTLSSELLPIQKLRALPAYQDFIEQDIQVRSPWRISLDGLNGSAGQIALRILQALGYEVDALNCDANGHFPLGAPDPSDPQRLEQLRHSILKYQSVIGIALDGDGDRLVVLDEQGQYVSPDRLMCLFAKICLQQRAQAEIVYDVKCSTMVTQTIQHYAGRATMIRTGSSFLRNYLYQHHAVFGGEFAGHYVFNDGRGKGYDDGLYAALRLLQYLDQTQQTLSTALAEFPERIATKDLYIASNGVAYDQVANCLIRQIDAQNMQLTRVDGIRLDFSFGFGLIRPSNTGEYFTVRFDADSPQHLDQIRQFFVESLQPHYPQIAQVMSIIHPTAF